MEADFHGAKAAIFIGNLMLVYQRDRAIPWPGYWDFAGGGREGAETPLGCLRREVDEEFGLTLPESAVHWQVSLPSMTDAKRVSWFFVVKLPKEAANDIRFGDEGQRWALMAPEAVMKLPNLVPALHDRLSLWLRMSGGDLI